MRYMGLVILLIMGCKNVGTSNIGNSESLSINITDTNIQVTANNAYARLRSVSENELLDNEKCKLPMGMSIQLTTAQSNNEDTTTRYGDLHVWLTPESANAVWALCPSFTNRADVYFWADSYAEDDSTDEGAEALTADDETDDQGSNAFVEPNYSDSEEDTLLSQYNYINTDDGSTDNLKLFNMSQIVGSVIMSNRVPRALLKKALAAYSANRNLIRNTSVLSIVDFSKYSRIPRFYMINMSTGVTDVIYVAHGKNSDPDRTGKAWYFSNVNGSKMSSLGSYLTLGTYYGKNGLSLRLSGLSATNRNVLKRGVVLHGSNWVSDYPRKQGMSWGCFAISMKNRTSVIQRLKGKSLIYAGQ